MKRNSFAFVLTAVLAASAPLGCGDDEGGSAGPDASVDPDADTANNCTVTPDTWTAPNFTTTAATELALRGQLDTLTGSTTMRGAEQETVTVDDVGDLTGPYETGTPSLKDSVSSELDAIIQDAFVDFVALIGEGQQDLVDNQGDWDPGANGGIFTASARGINTGGIEVRQIVDKGLFGGGALYSHALSLTEGTITEDTIDSFAAAYGANDMLASDDVTDSANYAFQMGFHAEIVGALTDAKAYAADDACTTERDEAIVTFFRTWEQALIARAVFYANAGSTELTAADDDDGRAGALHELAEGLGLFIGLYGLADPASGPLSGAGRVITNTDVEAMATALGVDLTDLSNSTIGSDFVETPANLATGVTAFEARAMTVYGFSSADIASFRTPTEG